MPYDVFGAMKAKCLPIGMGFERKPGTKLATKARELALARRDAELR